MTLQFSTGGGSFDPVFRQRPPAAAMLCDIPKVETCAGAFGSSAYTHTILSSAPDAKYFPLGEKRTA